MKKMLILMFLFFSFYGYTKDNIVMPRNPKDPDVSSLSDDKGNDLNKSDVKLNIEYRKQSGSLNSGIVTGMKGFYLKLAWDSNEDMGQEILVDFVKSIKIKGYTMVNKTKDKLTVVYYFPYLFDITLKDGKEIKNAKGRIKEIEAFTAYNSIGKEKCYTYFIRYWLEDKKIFTDNKSSNYYEKPSVPKNVVVFIKFN